MKLIKKFIAIMLIAAILLPLSNFTAYGVSSPATPSSDSTKLIPINIPMSMVKTNYKYSDILANAHGNNYEMILRETDTGDYVLSYIDNNMQYKDVNITPIIKKNADSKVFDIILYDVTYLDDKFYITGAYSGSDENYTHNFYLSTTDGNHFVYKKMIYNADANLGYLYKVGDTYIYTIFEGAVMSFNDGPASYYISKSLKNWKKVKTPSVKGQSILDTSWALETVTKDGIIVSVYTYTPQNEYYKQMYYTKDFKTYQKIGTKSYSRKSIANIRCMENGSLVYTTLNLNADEYYSSNKFMISTDYTTWNTIFVFTAPRDNPWSNHRWQYWNGNFAIFTDSTVDSHLYFYSNESESFTEYDTPLNATLIGTTFYDNEKKPNYSFTIYNNKYIVITNDNFNTCYMVEIPVNEIQFISFTNDSLIIMNDDNNYISMSLDEIDKAISATN